MARLHEKIGNQRRDISQKTARYLVNNYDLIAHEDLQIKNMVRNRHLAKSIHDSGWGVFFNMLTYKAAEAGRQVVKVSPHGTSQICSRCGSIAKKTLSTRVHKCTHCGIVLDRDVNAAKNILILALKTLGPDGAFGDSLAQTG